MRKQTQGKCILWPWWTLTLQAGLYQSIKSLDVIIVDREDPKAAEWLHWLVVNIPGDKIKTGDVELGKVLMQHNGPSPPKRSGMGSYGTQGFPS